MDSAIYRGFDQEALDLQYDNMRAVADHERYFALRRELSVEARERVGGSLDVAYGPGMRETLDIFPAGGAAAPVLLYIHGGYWRAGDKSDLSMLAPAWTARGITLVCINYPLAPGARMGAIVDACRRAVAWTWRNAATFGADAARLHVVGNSAGGHLAAMMLLTDWTRHGLPADAVKGGCAISGIYDLTPVPLTFMREVLDFTPAEIHAHSPVAQIGAGLPPAIFAVGADETGEFVRQQRLFVERWRAAGGHCRVLEPAGRNHFSITHDLLDLESDLSRALLDMMR